MWTDDPVLARRADAAGIERIGVDLERLGKAHRQRGLGTWVSPHTEADLRAIGAALVCADLFARVNPLNPDSGREVESVIGAGARVLMLPMVASAAEAATFVDLVARRARVVLLVERRDALDRLAELIAVEGVDEIHVGLNDLALSMGLPNRWLILAGDLMRDAGSRVVAAGLRFGLGGVGRVGDDALPIPTDLIYAEYARTGARAALVSRSFHAHGHTDLTGEIARLRLRLAHWCARPTAALALAHAELGRRASQAAEW